MVYSNMESKMTPSILSEGESATESDNAVGGRVKASKLEGFRALSTFNLDAIKSSNQAVGLFGP